MEQHVYELNWVYRRHHTHIDKYNYVCVCVCVCMYVCTFSMVPSINLRDHKCAALFKHTIFFKQNIQSKDTEKVSNEVSNDYH